MIYLASGFLNPFLILAVNVHDNLVAVREKVKDWLKSGSVENFLTKPYCVNPLNLVTKIDNGNGKVKNRPCIDMSRHLNKLMKEEKCKLDNLSVAEKTLEKDDKKFYFCKFANFLQILKVEHKSF